jgi:hypothetical protein
VSPAISPGPAALLPVRVSGMGVGGNASNVPFPAWGA